VPDEEKRAPDRVRREIEEQREEGELEERRQERSAPPRPEVPGDRS
jgi:hypothetical protein